MDLVIGVTLFGSLKREFIKFLLKIEIGSTGLCLFWRQLQHCVLLPGAEEPGACGNCGSPRREPEPALLFHYSPAPVEVGYILFTLLLPLVFKRWDLFM
jgi:hypothetical protein